VTRVHSFPPLSNERAVCLILGSMPGRASLQAGQYYAHPRNAFWPIIEQVFGIPGDLPYAQRCTQLLRRRVAVWDVLKTCTRTSSLDSDIVESTIVTNDFRTFFAKHPAIRYVYFNGAMAERTFARYVLPGLPGEFEALPRLRLPSTSPANASYSFGQKLVHWRAVAQEASDASTAS
jgi:TDG/mug DNA glycosylase family protein